MYGVGGERELNEETLDHLSGYGGAKPVRIGNGAYDQRQHDVWGMLLDSIHTHAGRGVTRQLSSDAWAWIEELVQGAIDNWQKPDRGICRLRQVTINQRGEHVMEQETTVFLKRRPVSSVLVAR